MTTALISAVALCAIATVVWLMLYVGKRQIIFVVVTCGFTVNMVGAWLIAIGVTGRPWKNIEQRYGVELLVHVIALNLLFIIAAACFNHVIGRIVSSGFRSRAAIDRPALRQGMLVLGIISAVVFWLYLSSLTANPLWAVITGEHNEVQLAELRDLATARFEGHYWHYNVVLAYMLPLVSWYYLCRMYIAKSRVDRYLWIVFSALAIYAATVSLQKFPVVLYAATTLLVFWEVSGRRRTMGRGAVLAMTLSVIIVATYVYFAGAQDSWIVILGEGVQRIVVGQMYPALFCLHIFPGHIGYLLGRTFPNPAGILPHTPFDLTYELWTYMFRDHIAGIHGGANTVYFMEWYVNFGYCGMYAIVPAAALFVALVSRIVGGISPPELRIPVLYLLAGVLFRLSLTSVFQVLEPVILIFCVVALLRLWASRRVPNARQLMFTRLRGSRVMLARGGESGCGPYSTNADT